MRTKFNKGEISEKEYKSFIKKKIEEVIKLQEEIGLDVLVHGEFERTDMVEFLHKNLKVLLQQNKDGFFLMEQEFIDLQ